MLGALLIVFREVLEAGLIVGIVMVATRGVPGRGRWITIGIAGGVLGAEIVAMFAGVISDAFQGSGQELFNAGVLAIAMMIKDQVLEGFRILLSSPKVRAVLVNIFGGIMKCDIIASALLAAYDEIDFRVPLVVRLEGTNADIGSRCSRRAAKIITADGLTDAARKVVAAAKGSAA